MTGKFFFIVSLLVVLAIEPSFAFRANCECGAACTPDPLLYPITKVPVATSVMSIVSKFFPEGKSPDSTVLVDEADPNLYFVSEGRVTFTFVHEGAGYRNVAGYYLFDANNAIISKHEVFPDLSFYSPGCIETGDQVTLGPFPAGTRLGWFLRANGYNLGATGGSSFFSGVNYAELNPDTKRHVAMIRDTATEDLIVGFEDLYNLGDKDYNDAMFVARVDPPGALDVTKIPSTTDGLINPAACQEAKLSKTFSRSGATWSTLGETDPLSSAFTCFSDRSLLPAGYSLVSANQHGFSTLVRRPWASSRVVLANGVPYLPTDLSTTGSAMTPGTTDVALLKVEADGCHSLQTGCYYGVPITKHDPDFEGSLLGGRCGAGLTSTPSWSRPSLAGSGVTVSPSSGHGGCQEVCAAASTGSLATVMSQTVILGATDSHRTGFRVGVWASATGVSGGGEGDFALYVDVEYTDGTRGAFIETFPAGTYAATQRIVNVYAADKEIARAHIHATFRGGVVGSACFSDWTVALPDPNILRNPSFASHLEGGSRHWSSMVAGSDSFAVEATGHNDAAEETWTDDSAALCLGEGCGTSMDTIGHKQTWGAQQYIVNEPRLQGATAIRFGGFSKCDGCGLASAAPAEPTPAADPIKCCVPDGGMAPNAYMQGICESNGCAYAVSASNGKYYCSLVGAYASCMATPPAPVAAPVPPTEDYSVYLDIEYADGKATHAVTAMFTPGSADWHLAQTVFPVSHPAEITRVIVTCLFRGLTGQAHFDRVFVDPIVDNGVGMRVGAVYGDPHLRTFDGQQYDNQAVGEFVLTRDASVPVPSGMAGLASGFDVQIRTSPAANNRASIISAASLRALCTQLQITTTAGAAAPVVTVHGGEISGLDQGAAVPLRSACPGVGGGMLVRHDLSADATLNGEAVVARYTASWADIRHTVDFTVFQSSYGVQFMTVLPRVPSNSALSGLLGNADGVQNDADFVLPSGQAGSAQDVYAFVDAWRVTDSSSAFSYLSGETTATFTDVAFHLHLAPPSGHSEAELAAAHAACAGVGISSVVDDCVYDVLLTGDTTMAGPASAMAAATGTRGTTVPSAAAEGATAPPVDGEGGGSQGSAASSSFNWIFAIAGVSGGLLLLAVVCVVGACAFCALCARYTPTASKKRGGLSKAAVVLNSFPDAFKVSDGSGDELDIKPSAERAVSAFRTLSDAVAKAVRKVTVSAGLSDAEAGRRYEPVGAGARAPAERRRSSPNLVPALPVDQPRASAARSTTYNL